MLRGLIVHPSMILSAAAMAAPADTLAPASAFSLPFRLIFAYLSFRLDSALVLVDIGARYGMDCAVAAPYSPPLAALHRGPALDAIG
jgi:hypothetical protein